MSVVGGSQLPIDVLGGMCTEFDPDALPPGVSPSAIDVAYIEGVPGTVKTRPGTTIYKNLFSNCTVNYKTSFIDLQGNVRNLFLTSLGDLWQEYPFGTFTLISAEGVNQGPIIAPYAKSDSAFGNEFIGFSDGKYGKDIPRRFNGQTFNRVTQDGPGAPPAIADYAPTQTLNVAASPAGLVQIQVALGDVTCDPSSNLVTAYGDFAEIYQLVDTLQGMPFGGNLADQFFVSGVDVSDYNGTWSITSISPSLIQWNAGSSGIAAGTGGTAYMSIVRVTVNPALTAGQAALFLQAAGALTSVTEFGATMQVRGASAADQVIYVAFITDEWVPGPISATGGGTIGVPGFVSAGVHGMAVAFVLDNGSITAPSPPVSWTAAGFLNAQATKIATGPPNVVARLLLFTAAGAQDYFYSETPVIDVNGNTQVTAFLIPDNVTTSWIVNFSDTGLLDSTDGTSLFDLFTLPEMAGFLFFAERIFGWGELNKVDNFLNMAFDGGFGVDGAANPYPLGWAANDTYPPGAGSYGGGVFGGAWTLIGTNVLGPHSMITQSAALDSEGIAILAQNTSYSIRFRANQLANQISNDTIVFELYSPSLGSLAKFSITMTALSALPNNLVTGVLGTLATVPADLQLRHYLNVAGTPSTTLAYTDEVEVYPTLNPYNASVVRASNIGDGNSFQGSTGFLLVSENDGQRLVNAGRIRDRMYFTKQHGLFSTTADASNEPNNWVIDTISTSTGAESINGCGAHIGETGEDWIFIFSRNGLYLFSSSEPPKISQEIQPTWETINWDYAYTAWIAIDIEKRRVLIGVPTGAATSPNIIFYMDYQAVGATASEIAENGPVKTGYTGKLWALTHSRKWALWSIAANSGDLIEGSDGEAHLLLGAGNGTGIWTDTGNVYELSDSAMSDFGNAIPGGGVYLTAFYPTEEQKSEPPLQAIGSRMMIRYLTWKASGTGNWNVTIFGPGYVNSTALPKVGAPSIALQSPASQDIEMYANFSAERMSFQISASGALPWWSCRGGVLYLAQDPVSPVRGFN